MAVKRVFLIVLDSFGIGEMPDAGDYQDEGSDTLASVATSGELKIPNLLRLGLGNIEGVSCLTQCKQPLGAFGRMRELSRGKDTTTGHWEIAGLISEHPMPVFPEGFPQEVIEAFETRIGRGVICNRPYSGTEVIRDYGQEHLDTGKLIVYTSADSVFQIAAHEEMIPIETLYEYCRIAREILTGSYGVGRVIARPFIGRAPNFTRTSGRHDFSLKPWGDTMLDLLQQAGYETVAVGKIRDIFAGVGINRALPTAGNAEGMEQTINIQKEDFRGLCFINLVDFDMLYGHRNDIDGYARALSVFDQWLPDFLAGLGTEDVLMITADHGCDPGTSSTDHSREYTPLLVYGAGIREGCDLKTRGSFADIAATILDMFEITGNIAGHSFYREIIK